MTPKRFLNLALIAAGVVGLVLVSRMAQDRQGRPVEHAAEPTGMRAAIQQLPVCPPGRVSNFASKADKFREIAAMAPRPDLSTEIKKRYLQLADRNSSLSNDWAVSTSLEDIPGECDRYALVTYVRPNSGFPEGVKDVYALLDIQGNILSVGTGAD